MNNQNNENVETINSAVKNKNQQNSNINEK